MNCVLYSDTMELYAAFETDIDRIYYDQEGVFEASSGTVSNSTVNASNATDNANNTITDNKKQNNLLVKAKKLIDTIRGYIQKCIDSIIHMLQNAWQTNYGFMSEIKDAEKKYTPITEPIQIINWNYKKDIQGFLYRPLNDLQTEINRAISSLANWRTISSDNVISMDDSDRLKYLFEKILKAPRDITNFNQYYLWLKKEFRGDKVTQTIQGYEVKSYMTKIEQYNNMKRNVVDINNKLKSQVNQTNSTLQQLMRSPNIEDKEKTSIMRYSRAISQMLNMYMNTYRVVIRLHTEYNLNCRAIVRKLYVK